MLTKLRRFVKEHMDKLLIVSTAAGTAFLGLAIAIASSQKSSSFLCWMFVGLGAVFFGIALYLAGILAIRDERRRKEKDKERENRLQREEALFNEQMDAFRRLNASEGGQGMIASERQKEIEEAQKRRRDNNATP